MALVGRDRETRILSGLLDAVADHGSALIVRGDAGIGKTALLEEAGLEAQGRGMTVLRTIGVQVEASLPYAGLHQALRPILGSIDALAPPQRAALESAFGIRGGDPSGFLVGLGALNLLAEVAGQAPVLLLADNVEVLDQPTRETLAFVARRVESDPIVLLAAIRDGSGPLLAAGLAELHVDPLDAHAATSLLDREAPGLARRLRREVIEQARGNPLALVELPRALRSSPPEPSVLPVQLPIGDRLQAVFVERLALLPRSTRLVLLAAALNDSESISEALEAAALVAEQAITVDDLAPAVDARLVDLDSLTLRFRHPLIRASVQQAASLADRRLAHQALASLLHGAPGRRAWHLAESTVGPDEDLAAQLVEASRESGRRGATETALVMMERAARLTVDPGRRAGHLLAATVQAFELGEPAVVARLMAEAQALDLGPTERAHVLWLHEVLEEGLAWDTARVRALLGEAGRAGGAGERDLAMNLTRAAALRCWWSGTEDPVRPDVTAAARRLGAGPGDPLLIEIAALAEPLASARMVVAAIRELDAAWRADTDVARLVGTAATVVGAFDVAAPLLRIAADRLRSEGRLAILAQVQLPLAYCALMTGDWNAAMVGASEAEQFAIETAQPRWIGGSRSLLAAVAGLRGRQARAESWLDAAERAARQQRSAYMLALNHWARGLVALGAGASAPAFDALRRLHDPTDAGHHLHVACWSIADLAEAAVGAGRLDDVRPIIEEVARIAAGTSSPVLEAGLAFATALVAPEREAEGRYLAGLSGSTAAFPFIEARTRLAYGIWLRRHRRIREARAPLDAARITFERLGAVDWGSRAVDELRAAGARDRIRSGTGDVDALTPQELNIAHLAADGLSNREIADRLFLSHRTVGSHLYRIFPKLGVASRSDLRTALGDEPPV